MKLAVVTRAVALALAGVLGVAAAHAADADRALEIVQGKCFICHGADGESSSPVFPRLAGQHAGYIERQLTDYRSGRRKSDTMRPMVEDLSAADFALLGRYFESRPVRAHDVADADLAQVGWFIFSRGNPYSGVPACTSCHGPKGLGSETLPRLAGQHAAYLENQLKKFNTRERTNDNAIMHSVASKLTELEAKAVSAYIAGLK